MEMLREAYQNAQEIAPQIREKIFPLPANIVTPLATFETESIESANTDPIRPSSDAEDLAASAQAAGEEAPIS